MRFLFIISVLIFSQNIDAQSKDKIDFSEDLDGINLVSIESIYDVTVRSHDNEELIISSTPMNNQPNKSKGLKPIYENEGDNTGVGCNVSKLENTLVIKSLRNFNAIVVYLPKKISIKINVSGTGVVNIYDMESEIEVSNINGNIMMKKVTGPITASTNSGNIEISMINLDHSYPITISSLTSDIDLALPENTKANLKLISDRGEVYSNFDIENKDKKGLDRTKRGLTVIGKINDGGNMITLKTVSGSIYLRKKE